MLRISNGRHPIPLATRFKLAAPPADNARQEEHPVTESWQPTLDDLAKGLADLADHVSRSKEPALEPYVYQNMRDLTYQLELHIPGLEPPPDRESADVLSRAAQMALDRGDEREALARALRGLSFAPHDPALFYLAASACFETGAVELALRLLYHTLWIHPGHLAARADLESLSAFLDDADEPGRAA